MSSNFVDSLKKQFWWRLLATTIIFIVWTVIVFYYHLEGSMGEINGFPAWILDGLILSFFLAFIGYIWLLILIVMLVFIGYVFFAGGIELLMEKLPLITKYYAFSLPMVIIYIIVAVGLVSFWVYLNWRANLEWKRNFGNNNYSKEERERKRQEQREKEEKTDEQWRKDREYHRYDNSKSGDEKEIKNKALGMSIESLKQEINKWQREFVKATDRNNKKKMEEANEKIRHLTELYKAMKEAKNKRDK